MCGCSSIHLSENLFGSFHETAEVVNSLQVSNRRYDEMQADFALVPLTISGMSQEEAL
jgi:hypothetical protein